MYEELEAAFAEYVVKTEEAKVHSDRAKALQQQLDTVIQSAHAKHQEGRDDLARVLNTLRFDVERGKVRPALLRLSPEQVIIAVGVDTLWVKQHDGVHIFGPADENLNRSCSICGRAIRWDVVNLGLVE